MTPTIQSLLGLSMRDIIASGCLSKKDLMINIKGLSKALADLEGQNVSIKQMALDLAANALLLSEQENVVPLTPIRKHSQMPKQTTLKIHDIKFLPDDAYRAGSPLSLMRKHVRSELTNAWQQVHGEPLPESISKEFTVSELKLISENVALFEERGIDLKKAGMLYKLCCKGSPVDVDEKFRINWILLNHIKLD